MANRHTDAEFARPGFRAPADDRMREVHDRWKFEVLGTGFRGTCRIELDGVPEIGVPERLSCGRTRFAARLAGPALVTRS